jgi:hypothetical protein
MSYTSTLVSLLRRTFDLPLIPLYCIPRMFIFYEFRPFYTDNARVIYRKIRYIIYLLSAVVFTSGGSSTVHIYTQTIHRIAQ